MTYILSSIGLVQVCSNSSVLAMELLQSCTKPWYLVHEVDKSLRLYEI